jgi:DNA end-binding protein Ku
MDTEIGWFMKPELGHAATEVQSRVQDRTPIIPNERPAVGNVVDGALLRSVGQDRAPKPRPKKPRKAATGQKEMLLAISGKKPAKENAAKKTTPKPQRKH